MLDLMDKLNRTQSAEMEAPMLRPRQMPAQESVPPSPKPEPALQSERPKLRLRPLSTAAAASAPIAKPPSPPAAAEPDYVPDYVPEREETPDTHFSGKRITPTEPSLYTSPAQTELEVHVPDEADMPDALRRTAADTASEHKSRWNWKGIFPASSEKVKPNTFVSVTDESIIQSLTSLGLSPSAVVDDGCIIEAANLRKVKGALAMSEAITKRLGEPVRHLFRAAEKDTELKTNIRAFTDQFNARLSPVENDREAIRAKLESEAGRAYLLCDAALNG